MEEGSTPEVLAAAATLDDAEGPAAAHFRFLRALALEGAGRRVDALPLLRSAISLSEDDLETAARARVWLSDLYVMTGDGASGRALVPALREDLGREGLDVSVRVASGLCAARRLLGFEPAESLHALLDAVETLGPDDPELRATRAAVYAAEGDLPGAESAIGEVDRGPTRLRLAQLAHRRGDNGAAIRWCHELLAEDPPAALRDGARLCLGMASWHAGRYDDAERAFVAVARAEDGDSADRDAARTNLILLSFTQGRAISAEEEAFLFAPEREELPDVDVLHTARGMFLLFMRGDAARAAEAFEAAIVAVDREEDPDHAVEILALRGLALSSLGRGAESAQSFADADALAPRASPSVRARLSQLRGFAGFAHADPHVHASAERDLREAEEGFAAAGRPEVVAALRLRRARAAASRGALEACLSLLDAVACVADDEGVEGALLCSEDAFSGGYPEVVAALCERALSSGPSEVQRDRARLQRCVALASIDGARALAEADAHLREAGDSRENRQLRVNRVGMLLDAGRPVPEAEQAFVLDDARLEDAVWPDVVCTVRAALWQDLAMPERAQEELARIVGSSPEGRRLAALQEVLFAYGRADAGRIEDARASLRRALALAEGVAPPLRGGILVIAGFLQTTIERPEDGRDTLRRCLAEHAERGIENDTTRVARIHLALACALAGDPEADRARDALVAMLDALGSEGLRALALRTLGTIDGDPTRLVEAAACFEGYGDLAAAAGALDLACIAATDGASGREHLRRALALGERHRAAMRDGRDRVSLRRASGARAERLAVIHALGGEPARAAETILALHGGDGASLPAILAAIPPGALAVEYALGEDAVTALVLTDGALSLRRAGWTADDAAALSAVDGLGALLTTGVSPQDVRSLERAVDALSSRLIAPIADLLEGRELVLVAPGLELTGVPFAALAAGPGSPSLLARGVTVARLLTLSQIPTLRSLASRGREARVIRGDDALAAGPELPAADAEVARVAARLSNAGWTLSEGLGEADSTIGRAGWIHYAGHIRRSHEGGDACLFVAGRRLDAEVLRGWSLEDAPVVVLSGCESGAGRGRDSDVHQGLVRPLFDAGARGVLSSLWPVSDERTLGEMERFYAALPGRSPADALAFAARATREESLALGIPEVLARLLAANFHFYGIE